MANASGYDDYPFVAEIYDYVYTPQMAGDVDFYVEMAKESGGPVLELGCGTGRVLLPIARAGLAATGLDLSEFMLAVLRQKLEREDSQVRDRVRIVTADMRRFDLGKSFPLITIPFRAFQHLLELDDQLSCLACIREHLAPKGHFILNVFNPSIPLMTQNPGEEQGDEPEITMSDGRKVRRRWRSFDHDWHRQVFRAELIYYVKHPDGRKERLVHAFPLRFLYRYEAEHLLVRSGFDIEALYADFDRSSFGSKYPGELIFVTTKR